MVSKLLNEVDAEGLALDALFGVVFRSKRGKEVLVV
jgi:hypothetical protein